MNRTTVAFIFLLVPLTLKTAIADESSDEWVNLLPQADISKNAVAGTWQRSGNEITTSATRSSRLTLPFQPKSEYDFRVEFTRTSGIHSVALMFVAGGKQATFEIDAWGQHLAGIQMIDGQTMQNNSTRSEGHTLQNGKKYAAMVQVRRDRVRVLLDDQLIAEHKSNGSDLSLRRLANAANQFPRHRCL